MKHTEAMYAWGPRRGRVAGKPVMVGPWPDRSGWSDPYLFTGGACYTALHGKSPEERKAQLFIDFHTMVVRDGVPPPDAHEAFLAIDEYRASISPDIKGADPD